MRHICMGQDCYHSNYLTFTFGEMKSRFFCKHMMQHHYTTQATMSEGQAHHSSRQTQKVALAWQYSKA